MKKLQNNFTTPEQSKRLLELGVPAWTADLRYRICKANDSVLGNPYLTKGKKYIGSHFNSSLPCWSVGRLIEIMNICSMWGHVSIHRTDREVTQIEQLIEILQNRINGKTIDFSKLEE